MAKFYDEIPESLIEWIKKQHMFWVASAPLSPGGHVNVSPKGTADCFHVVDSRRVWYQDLSGSGECPNRAEWFPPRSTAWSQEWKPFLTSGRMAA